jgi:DNA-directed RNA polymerase III subunit RPC1
VKRTITDTLLQIASVLEEAWAPDYTYIGIIVDMVSVQKLQVRRIAKS